MNVAPRHPVAIDLSCSQDVSALQMTSRRGVAVVSAAARNTSEAEGPALSDADRTAFVRDVLGSPMFKGRSIALLPPLETVLSYPLRVEVGRQESLEEAIVREAGAVLSFPLEEAMLDYASVQPDPAGKRNVSHVLVVATPRANVEQHAAWVHEAGGVLEVVESAATALVRAHGAVAPLGPEPVLLCHVGRERSMIVVVSREGIVAHRNAHWGTNDLRLKLTENLELGNQQRDADFLLRHDGLSRMLSGRNDHAGPTAGGQTSVVVSQLLAPLADTFVHELHNTTGYVRSQMAEVTFGGIFLYGDGALVRGLGSYLAEGVGMTMQVVNPLDKIGLSSARAVPDPNDGARYALVLGLAMRRVRWL